MTNSFHNSSLRDAVQESESVFNSFVPNLNQMSQDIKNLEIYLKNKSISIEYQLKIHDFFVDDQDINPNFDTSTVYLKWGKYNGDFRLIFREADENERFETIENEREKPLIECGIEDRANAYKFLDVFVRNLRAEVQSTLEGYYELPVED